MPITLDQLNAAPLTEAVQLLDGLYEHSPWIAELAMAKRPFASLAALKHACAQVLHAAGPEPQLALIRAHPELAGKAMVSQTLTAESTNEQSKAGLTNCTPDEFAHIQRLNADYNARFGFPFILAVRGPRGTGLSKAEIIATFERRLHNPVDFEQAECLRHIHRIAEIRLNDKFGVRAHAGSRRLGLARIAGAAHRPRLRRARSAHRHLPHRCPPCLCRSVATADARLRF